MSSPEIEWAKLKDESNYSTWAELATDFLVRENYIQSLDDIIVRSNPADEYSLLVAKRPSTDESRDRESQGLAALKLMVEEGPLRLIEASGSLGDAWLALKDRYDESKFSPTVTLMRKFLRLTCRKGYVDEFLQVVRQIHSDLESQGIALPPTFITVWVIERLEKSYNDFKACLYARLRDDENAYTFETLSEAIHFEFQRRKACDDLSGEERKDAGLVKKKKKGYCNHCRMPGHSPHECWDLHPHLKPKGMKVFKKTGRVGSMRERDTS